MSETNQQSYRTGLICQVGEVRYWHTGAKYWVAVESADGEQSDLREFQGFKKLDERFSHSSAIFFDADWNDIAEAEPEIAVARKVLRDRAEMLWWTLVEDFLKSYHQAIQCRSQALSVLRDSGMAEATIEAVLVG